jgi:pantetheine-phosphate adenylyltransferase
MIKAIFAGSFDPPHLGHMDLIKRSCLFCDRLIVAVGVNFQKKTLFSEAERLDMLNVYIYSGNNKIDISSYQGLLIDYAKSINVKYLIRGIRSAADFEYETNLANINKLLAPEIETIFLPTKPELAVVSSSAAKEIAKYGGDLTKFVPSHVAQTMHTKFGFVKYEVDKCPYCGKSDTLKWADDKPSFQYCRECGQVVRKE